MNMEIQTHSSSPPLESILPNSNTSLSKDAATSTALTSLYSTLWGHVEQVLPQRTVASLIATGHFAQGIVETSAIALQAWMKPEIPNKVNYSPELIDISEGAQEPVPKTGEIIAGSRLRTEFTETAMDIMLSSFQEKGREAGFIDLEKDMNRATFILQGHEASTKIGDPGYSTAEAKQGVTQFKNFIGVEHADCANAMARLMNQTLFTSSEALGSGSPRELPTQGITRSQNKKFTATGIKYYASIRTDVSSTLDLSALHYTLRKEETEEGEHYILEALAATPSICLFLTENSTDPTKDRLIICSDKHLKINETTFFSYKITPNPAFEKEKEVTSENFPCAIVCRAFSHNYTVEPVSTPSTTPENR